MSRRSEAGRGLRWPRVLVLLGLGWHLATPVSATGAEEAVASGRQIYEQHCQKCHGSSGAGDGETAVRLKFHARDFSRGAFKCRSTPTGMLPTEADLVRTVTRGLPGTPMTGFGGVLKPEEIARVVSYIRGFSPRFASDPPAVALDLPELPRPSDSSVAEGRQVYRFLQCWKCHGPSGAGDGPDAAGLKDDWGVKVKPGNLRSGRLKCGAEPADLYRSILTGTTGSPMPSFDGAFLFGRASRGALPAVAGVFGEAAAAELVAYLDRQPEEEAIAALPEPERRELARGRAAALVHYLASLPTEAR